MKFQLMRGEFNNEFDVEKERGILEVWMCLFIDYFIQMILDGFFQWRC